MTEIINTSQIYFLMKEASSRGRIPFMKPRKYIGRDLYLNGNEMLKNKKNKNRLDDKHRDESQA